MKREHLAVGLAGAAVVLALGLATTVTAANGAGVYGERTIVMPEPRSPDHGCTGMAELSVRKSADGRIAFDFSGISRDCIAQKAGLRPVYSLYLEAVPGLPAPAIPDQSELTDREKMLVNGFCYEYWNGNPRYISPVSFALAAVNMHWSTNGCLPESEYGLLYADKPVDYNREGAFWRQQEWKQLTNAATFCNPLRDSIIRVNPPEARSPGDIYLEKLMLTGDQTEHLRPFAEKHHSATDRGYLLTVHGSSGQVLMRGILFMQPVRVVHIGW